MLQGILTPHNNNEPCPIIEDMVFTKNWNNKLHCDCFSSIRSVKIEVGQYRHIILHEPDKEPLNIGTAIILEVIERKFENLNDWVCYQDNGSNAENTRKYLTAVAKKDLTGRTFYVHLIKFEEPCIIPTDK